MSSYPHRSFSQPSVPLSSSPSLTSPIFWRDSRSTPRTSFDTNPVSSSSRKHTGSSDPTPFSKAQLRDVNALSANAVTATATRLNPNPFVRESERATNNSGVSTVAVGTGFINGMRNHRIQDSFNQYQSPSPFSDQAEDNSPYSGPNIWPSAEGIHVRLDKKNGEQRTALINQLIGSGARFQGVDEDGSERTSEWTLLKWDVLEGFLLDERNTDHLDDSDILKRVGKWLRGQAILRSQRANLQPGF